MKKQANSSMCCVSGVAAPFGLHLGGRTLAGTALSILSESVTVKNGHSGRSLRETKGRIGG